MSKLKIAVYHNLRFGGGLRALSEILRRLSEIHNIDVYQLSCSDQLSGESLACVGEPNIFPYFELSTLRSPFGRLNPLIKILNLFRLHKVEQKVAKRIDQLGYDLVLVNPCFLGQSSAILQFLASPTVYFCHEPPRWIYDPHIFRPYENKTYLRAGIDKIDFAKHLYRSLFQIWDRKNSQAATRVLANSDFSRETIKRVYGLDSWTCYPGVDFHTFKKVQREKGDYVLSVGGMAPHKGFDFLIRSIGHIPTPQRPGVQLACNGINHSELEFIQELATKHQVELSVNTVSDTELINLYTSAKVTACSPVLEPFGLVPIESMSCGTPVVGVREGGIRENIIHQQTGLLVERDVIKFAEAVMQILNNPGLGEQFGENGRQWVIENRSWESTINCLEENMFSTVRKYHTQ